MQTQVGLAFGWRLLNAEQRQTVKRFWMTQPLGRYLLPWEMGKLAKVNMQRKIEPHEDDEMQSTWIKWCRQNNHDQQTIPGDCEEWFSWLDFAAEKYSEVLPAMATDWNAR